MSPASDNGRTGQAGAVSEGPAAAHGLVVYDTDEELVELVVAHLAGALKAGGAAVSLATASHRSLIEIGLRGAGMDPVPARLLSLDAAAVVSVLVAPRGLVPARARWLLAGLIEQAPAEGGPVACYVEPMIQLWQQADLSAVLALEGGWDELAASIPPLDLVCGYPAAALAAAGPTALAALRDRHATVATTAAARRLKATPPAGPEEAGGPAPPGPSPASRQAPRRQHPREQFVERVRQANQALADELREAQSRAQALADTNCQRTSRSHRWRT